MTSTAIYINGTSSSGKTTLARLLQEKLPEPYLLTGIDLLIREMLPKQYFFDELGKHEGFYWTESFDDNDKLCRQLQHGPVAERVYQGLIASTVALLESGNNVIIDDVAYLGAEQTQAWRQALSPFHLLTVGLHCPIDMIEEREKARGNRMPGSAYAQFSQVHADMNYDITYDSSQLSAAEIADSIISLLPLAGEGAQRADEGG